ncbi:hypothetical protein, partial [Escherichia coli]|uniref:hypothetical protein n=1 Tax=Escherichia coli TaxID=562 RepID=UPI000A595A42
SGVYVQACVFVAKDRWVKRTQELRGVFEAVGVLNALLGGAAEAPGERVGAMATAVKPGVY